MPPIDRLQELELKLRELITKIDAKIINDSAKFQQIETNLALLKSVNEEEKLRENVEALESRVNQLKNRFTTPKAGGHFSAKNFLRLLLDYWTLIAFVFAVVIAGYVYWGYGVSYVESYKVISDTKKSAEYYKETGDSLMPRAEFGAAEDAYKTALEINPNYLEARQGLMKTQILKPMEGYNDYTPVVVEAKLNYLQRISPNDYLIPYFKGILQMKQDHKKEARTLFLESRSKNPEFVGNYDQLGHLDLFDGNFDLANQEFSEGLRRVPNHPLLLTSLGASNMLAGKVKEAISQLEEAAANSQRLETLLILGEAYRNIGRSSIATFNHEKALGLLKDPKLKEGANYGMVTLNYLPTKKRPDIVRSFEQASNYDQYKTLIYYALSIDYALQRKFSEANTTFDIAYKTDQTVNGEKAFGCYYVNRLEFLTDSQKLVPTVKTWFAGRHHELDPNNSCEL